MAKRRGQAAQYQIGHQFESAFQFTGKRGSVTTGEDQLRIMTQFAPRLHPQPLHQRRGRLIGAGLQRPARIGRKHRRTDPRARQPARPPRNTRRVG